MVKNTTSTPALTQERLRELLSYDPETGQFTWVARRQRVRVGQVAGTKNKYGYLQIGIDGRKYALHRLAWLWVTGEWPPKEIDHINRDSTDNRFANLRLATSSQNNCNQSMRGDNTSGVKGVSWNKKSGKWHSRIVVNGKYRHLGLFSDLKDAASAYEVAAQQAFGEFAHTVVSRLETTDLPTEH